MLAEYIEKNPTSQSIRFAGEYINMSAIARDVSVTPSTLSLIFNGKRNPSYALLRRLSLTMGMSMDEFSSALSERIVDIFEKAS